MGGVRWSESLTGPLSFDQSDFNQATLEGDRDGARVTLTLTLQMQDVERFARRPSEAADVVRGRLEAPDLGGRLDVDAGTLEMFTQADDLLDHLHLRMRYRLNLVDPQGRRLHLHAFKLLENDPGYDSWADTTTLFSSIYSGWRPVDSGGTGEPARRAAELAEHDARTAPEDVRPIAIAVLKISPVSFLRELGTFRGTDPSAHRRACDVTRFQAVWLGSLLKAYVGPPITDGRPSFPSDRPRRPWPPRGSPQWQPVPGRGTAAPEDRGALVRKVHDLPVKQLAFPLTLQQLARPDGRGKGSIGERGPVLLAHGAGVRAEMFYGQPRHRTVVDVLLDKGYDVWALNWRGSIDLPNVSYTLDQVARFDHPAAVQKVYDETGEKVRALVHCQGSVSFMMAAAAGLLPRDEQGNPLVTHVVSSAISLFFVMTDAAWRKQRLLLPLMTRVALGADPQSGIRAINPTARGLAAVSKLTERPCGNAPCQVANYIYGAGWDTLLCHDNIDDEVHAWTARELGYTPLSLISQVAEATRYGHVVPAGPLDPDAPATYVEAAPTVGDTRFTLLGCERDTMFLSAGQRRTDAFLKANAVDSDYVSLPGYGHMDAYWGPRAAVEVFPRILAGLEWDGTDKGRPSRVKPPLNWKAPKKVRGRPRGRRRWIPAPQFSAPPPS